MYHLNLRATLTLIRDEAIYIVIILVEWNCNILMVFKLNYYNYKLMS